MTDPFDRQTRDEFPAAVAIQPDGRVVVAGTVIAGGLCLFALARLKPVGTVDAAQ